MSKVLVKMGSETEMHFSAARIPIISHTDFAHASFISLTSPRAGGTTHPRPSLARAPRLIFLNTVSLSLSLSPSPSLSLPLSLPLPPSPSLPPSLAPRADTGWWVPVHRDAPVRTHPRTQRCTRCTDLCIQERTPRVHAPCTKRGTRSSLGTPLRNRARARHRPPPPPTH